MYRSRRQMMKLIGMAPFLAPAFRDALAADPTPLKRLAILMRFNGAPIERWIPKSWDDFNGSCLASLNDAKIKSRLTVLESMDNKFVDGSGDSHALGARSAWAARPISENGLSLDQYIANKMNFPTVRRNLSLGVYANGIAPETYVFFKAPGSPADINDDPYDAINKVFGDFVPKGNGSDPKATALLAKKKSILDALKDDVGRMSKNLVGAEKEKLETHLALVRAAEQSLSASMGNMQPVMSGCKKAEVPQTKYPIRSLVNLPDLARVQIELATLSMACDISRVVVIQMLASYTNVGGGDVDLTWCGANIGRDNKSGFRDAAGDPVLSLHQYHHASRNDIHERGVYANINTTYATLFGELMKKLDAIPDGTGTLLDNSIAVLGSEYGGDTVGPSHNGANMPWLLGGGGGGFLKTGHMPNLQGASHTQLLGTLLEYFGLEDGTGSKSTDFGNRSRGLSYASLKSLKKV
jgi:Protein of unknown function (DUF1552)